MTDKLELRLERTGDDVTAVWLVQPSGDFVVGHVMFVVGQWQFHPAEAVRRSATGIPDDVYIPVHPELEAEHRKRDAEIAVLEPEAVRDAGRAALSAVRNAYRDESRDDAEMAGKLIARRIISRLDTEL